MKKTKIILLCLLLMALVLEILPYGAVCNFATPEKRIRKTYSYFDLVPFGYANFGPLITGILTCVLLSLAVIYLFCDSRGVGMAIAVLSVMAFAASLAPLLFGYTFFSAVGACISIALASVFLISLTTRKFF